MRWRWRWQNYLAPGYLLCCIIHRSFRYMCSCSLHVLQSSKKFKIIIHVHTNDICNFRCCSLAIIIFCRRFRPVLLWRSILADDVLLLLALDIIFVSVGIWNVLPKECCDFIFWKNILYSQNDRHRFMGSSYRLCCFYDRAVHLIKYQDYYQFLLR